MGSIASVWLWAGHFRSSTNNGRYQTALACLKRANSELIKLRPHWITSSARLTHATGSEWSAVSVSKIMKRPSRVRNWIAAALAAGRHVAALPRNEMNSFRRMRAPLREPRLWHGELSSLVVGRQGL